MHYKVIFKNLNITAKYVMSKTKSTPISGYPTPLLFKLHKPTSLSEFLDIAAFDN